MSDTVTDILTDMVEALRTSGQFRLVCLQDAASSTDVPRACISYEGQESFAPDDCGQGRWIRLAATVSVHTRSTEPSERIGRICQLGQAAIDALLSDRFRGQRCTDLPIGQATEVSRIRLDCTGKRPEVEMTFDVRCHFQTPEDS